MITDDELIRVDNILVDLEYWKARCGLAEFAIRSIKGNRIIAGKAILSWIKSVNCESDKAAYLESLKQKQQ